MVYSKCKQALYDSKEMGRIPDSWKEEAPIIFDEGGKRKIGFLFSRVEDGKTSVKKLIAVSIEDVEVTEYTADQLKEKFQVTDQCVNAIKISDYDEYFMQKDMQEKALSDVLNGNVSEIERFVQLTKELFSSEQYQEIVLRIGGEFYKR